MEIIILLSYTLYYSLKSTEYNKRSLQHLYLPDVYFIMESTGKYIIHYDDECSFCRQSAKIAGDFDKKKKFRFMPLQTDTSNKPHESAEASDSVIFYMENKRYYKSTAVLLIAKELGFPWSMLYFFILIPESFRDRLYDFVAGRRKRMK